MHNLIEFELIEFNESNHHNIWRCIIVCSNDILSFIHEMAHFSARGLIKLDEHYDVEGLPSLVVSHFEHKCIASRVFCVDFLIDLHT